MAAQRIRVRVLDHEDPGSWNGQDTTTKVVGGDGFQVIMTTRVPFLPPPVVGEPLQKLTFVDEPMSLVLPCTDIPAAIVEMDDGRVLCCPLTVIVTEEEV